MAADHENRTERLPDAELAVMQVLWDSAEPMKTARILEALDAERDWAMSTLQALLSRLEKRGFVESEKHKHNRYYYPSVDRDGYRLTETKGFLQRMYGSSLKSMVAAMIDGEAIAEADMEEIAEMLRKAGVKDA